MNYHLILSKKREFFSLFLFFIAVISLFIVTHHTYLGVQDEAMLQATLFNNEPINYMTSYPLAVLMGYLYTHLPSIAWYSVMMTAYIVCIAFILSLYIVWIKVENRGVTLLLKTLLFVLSLSLLVYMLLEVDVTTPTLLLIVLAIPLIRSHQIYFWVLLWIATFLREQIIVSVVPLIALAYLMQVSKDYFTRKRILVMVLVLGGILFNHFSYKLDKTYSSWMAFTEARAYYSDFGGYQTKGILSDDEYQLAKGWWLIDLDLYPSDKIMKAAGSTGDIVEERVLHENPRRQLRKIIHNHVSLYILLGLSLFLAFSYKSWLKGLLYIGYLAGFLLLMMVKDVERVTLPITLLWWVLIVSDIWCIQYKKWHYFFISLLMMILGWVIYFMVETIPLDRITKFEKKEALAHECLSLIEKNNMELEITSGYPASWDKLIDVIMQNHLFDENHWLGYHNHFLLSGWLTRVPLVYKQHNVSFDGVARKYPHYHDWLIQKHTGIIGSKGETRHVRPFLVQRLMKMYDKRFPKSGCHHETVVVDESKHFIIHQVKQICTGILPLDTNSTLLTSALWKLEDAVDAKKVTNMRFSHDTLYATNNDPRIQVQPLKAKKNVVLDIALESRVNTLCQIFYKLKGNQPYNELNTLRINLKKGNNHIRYEIPKTYILHGLRIDPVAHKGQYKVKSFAIYSK